MDSMTIKEVSDILRCSETSIRNSISELFPNLMQNGIKTLLNEYHVTAIKNYIGKTNLAKSCELVTTELEEEIIIAKAIQLQQNKIKKLQNQIIQKDAKIKRLVHNQKLYTTTEIAKELNLKSAQELNRILKDKNIQYFINGTWVLKAEYSDKNYESIKQMELDTGQVIYDRKWTGKDRDFILELFSEC